MTYPTFLPIEGYLNLGSTSLPASSRRLLVGDDGIGDPDRFRPPPEAGATSLSTQNGDP